MTGENSERYPVNYALWGVDFYLETTGFDSLDSIISGELAGGSFVLIRGNDVVPMPEGSEERWLVSAAKRLKVNVDTVLSLVNSHGQVTWPEYW